MTSLRGLRTLLPLAVLWLACGGLVEAQIASGRVSGRVTGPDDEPLAGAQVRIWSPGEADGVASTSETDDEGRWRVFGLEPGRWRISAEADGHFPAEGWFQILASKPEASVDVSLRSLAETSPSFAENASTVVRWVEKGNALLAQGQPAAARAEYEKAVAVLPRDQRPQVLQAMARTHFLEGDTDRSIELLREALTIAPESSELRELFATLLETTGRGDETETLLAEASRAAAGEIASRQQVPGPRLQLSTIVEAIAGRTGRFRTAFEERSTLSDLGIYLDRFELDPADLEASDPAAGVYDLAGESFEVYVPESYSPDDPHGLFVWVSPTPFGGFRNPDFERVLSERKLIWIGAHNSGNGRLGWYRVGLALDAVHNARSLYSIDERRVYVSGYSGGGRIASSLAMLYSDMFTGGFFVYGCDYFEPLPVPDRPGSFWPARFPEPPHAVVERLKRESRFALLTGDADFNRSQTKQIHRRMSSVGFEHLTYLQIPGANHYFGLPPEWLERGLDALDP